jgi:hypothetical protein
VYTKKKLKKNLTQYKIKVKLQSTQQKKQIKKLFFYLTQFENRVKL